MTKLWTLFLWALLILPASGFAQEEFSTTSGRGSAGDSRAMDAISVLESTWNNLDNQADQLKDHATLSKLVAQCSNNEQLQWSAAQNAWQCVEEVDPIARTFAKTDLPSCGDNQVLTEATPTTFVCVNMPDGDQGDTVRHQWSGTSLRFENPNGTWGSYVNLKGPKGNDVVCAY